MSHLRYFTQLFYNNSSHSEFNKLMRTNHPGAQPKPADEIEPGMLFSCLQGSYKYVNGKPISNKDLKDLKGKVRSVSTWNVGIFRFN